MKYYYKKPADWVGAGTVYICNHPVYNRCTLYKKGTLGLAVVQERFNEKTKARWWSTIDPWLSGDIYLNENFDSVFDEHAREMDEKGLYPTFTVRELMWLLKMKPLRREEWEKGV